MKTILILLGLLGTMAAVKAADPLPYRMEVSTNVVRIEFETPAAGTYHILSTSKLCGQSTYWHLSEGRVEGKIHVTVPIRKDGDCMFFHVDFTPSPF